MFDLITDNQAALVKENKQLRGRLDLLDAENIELEYVNYHLKEHLDTALNKMNLKLQTVRSNPSLDKLELERQINLLERRVDKSILKLEHFKELYMANMESIDGIIRAICRYLKNPHGLDVPDAGSLGLNVTYAKLDTLLGQNDH